MGPGPVEGNAPLPQSMFRLGVRCVDVGTVNGSAFAKFAGTLTAESDVAYILQ